jgi:hypothetical protein
LKILNSFSCQIPQYIIKLYNNKILYQPLRQYKKPDLNIQKSATTLYNPNGTQWTLYEASRGDSTASFKIKSLTSGLKIYDIIKAVKSALYDQHERSLPASTAIKASNPGLTVIVESGDGCIYGEGGNHFPAAPRRNPDITDLVHGNMVYGLTKGQDSPTGRRGFTTPVQITGVFLEPFNPVAVAAAMIVSFV